MRYAIHWCIFRQVTEWNEKWNVFCTIFTSWVWCRRCSKNFLQRARDCTFNIIKRRNNTTLKGFDVRNRSTMDKLIIQFAFFSTRYTSTKLFLKLFPLLAHIKTPRFGGMVHDRDKMSESSYSRGNAATPTFPLEEDPRTWSSFWHDNIKRFG